VGKDGTGSCPWENFELVQPAGKHGTCPPSQRENMELVLSRGKLITRSSQQEILEMDPASWKTWNWILPTEKFGNGSCQRENFELDPAKENGNEF
jgi:hypothetical protein